jgi:DNA/RNA-binding domain of Phe-tRNA-synthetase-like protein
MLILSKSWQAAHPDAHIGILAMHNVATPDHAPALDERKAALEAELRQQFDGQTRSAIKALPTIRAYTGYYKRFKKTYHVQHQLESVALKGRDIPRTAALVEAMFMAELENLLLTAGHDLDAVRQPVTVHSADGTETYVGISGQELILKAGDMFIADAEGVLSSIIYGPARRAKIGPEIRNVLFTVYAPVDIDAEAVDKHLRSIRDYVHLVTPDAEVEELSVYSAESRR